MDRMHLTQTVVESLDTGGKKQRVVWDQNTPGLGMKVGKTKKSWVVRYRPHGAKEQEVTIGSWPGMSVKEARQKAAQIRSRAAGEGFNPLIERRQKRMEFSPQASFQAVMERYWTTDQKHLQLKQRKQEEALVRNHVFPAWAGRPVVTITSADAMFLLEGIATKHPVQANRILFALRRPFRWMVRHQLILNSPVADLERPTPEKKRDRVLSDAEVKAIWVRAASEDVYGRLVRFLLLTGLRRDEARLLRWDELDGIDETDGSMPVAYIPAERMKNKQPHTLPLNPLALGVLADCPRVGPYVFAVSKKPYSALSRAKVRFDRDLEVNPWSLHDFRRTVRTHLAALEVPEHVSERVLAHSQGKLIQVYNRHEYLDEKRDALARWEAQLRRIIGENVTPFPAAASSA